MPKRDREHWGSLVPHNSLCGRRPVPLCSPTIVIGKDGDVTAPHNPHLSKHHIRLERVDDGSVYATHLSALNDTWLNGAKLERDRRTLVVPCAGNAPFSLRGEAPDAPLLFVSVPHAEAGRAGVQDKKLNGWQTIFRGVRLLVATRLCKQVQEGVVRRGGGEVVGGVQEATHVTLECHRRAEELLSLKTIPRDEWPRLVTQEWVGQCSKVLSADGTRTGVLRKHLHPDAVERREPPSPASPASSPPFLPDPRPAVAHPADPPAAAVDSGREGGSGGGSDDPNEVAIIDGREHRWVPAASGAPESRLWPGGFTRLTEFRNCAGLEWRGEFLG
ncbi:hypothetical protein EMIHUDRAFT_237586 [Emiliania huxleyi CCMP1516]|uniref:FHA domain-containing protein n=2 Tax=Emiliania huxleyi TaxID=2903 RepID=A0A0D3JPY4_EMIH1|nr:hypothetical protein EMIHUDRAFT_237586 [Emiliania huxleyi CCMP1516]EOD25569.1 hypothetical protein EMIHUDRAFT_237586 [Emiliania huxleyi CCMP1516]|eukprot:XP_005777998.1 hypothetical protein EMIHUDRAFT_237586 [Emiliania huxleyi CCMP1516]